MKPTILTIIAIASIYAMGYINKFHVHDWWNGPTMAVIAFLNAFIISTVLSEIIHKKSKESES